MKIFKTVDGNCKDCTLTFECSKDKRAIKHFVESKGLICENGQKIVVCEVMDD